MADSVTGVLAVLSGGVSGIATGVAALLQDRKKRMDIERRLSLLEKQVVGFASKATQAKHDEQLEAIERTLIRIDARITAVERDAATLHTTTREDRGTLTEVAAAVRAQLPLLATVLERLEKRLDRVESRGER